MMLAKKIAQSFSQLVKLSNYAAQYDKVAKL